MPAGLILKPTGTAESALLKQIRSPDLNPVHSDLPILARMYGIEYQELLEKIMNSAIRRAKI